MPFVLSSKYTLVALQIHLWSFQRFSFPCFSVLFRFFLRLDCRRTYSHLLLSKTVY